MATTEVTRLENGDILSRMDGPPWMVWSSIQTLVTLPIVRPLWSLTGTMPSASALRWTRASAGLTTGWVPGE